MGEAIISRGGQSSDVVNNLLTTVTGSALDAYQGKVLDDKITSLNTKLESINYVCTGTADSTAIATLINNFFNSGTAMTMKITITGTMGIAFTNTYYAMEITASNTRGAVCHLDFSNCHIPTITTITRDFLRISSTTSKLVIEGLNVKASRYGVNLNGSKNSIFNNCTITSGSSMGAYLLDTGNNIFNNCTITSGGSSTNSLYISGNSDNNIFNNCTFTDGNGTSNSVGVCFASGYIGISIFTSCKIITLGYGIHSEATNTAAVVKLTDCQIKGGVQDVYQYASASTMKWNIKGCSFSRSSIYVNATTVSVSTTVANAYLFVQAYANLFSQTIT